MHQPLPTIDFRSIRPYHGKQSDGFEEISVQLFRGETKGKGEFYRIDGSGGDGGVEAFRQDSNGGKLGLQSKYFDNLGASQWRQINDSVKVALGKHPTLFSYFISLPLNRTPAQTKRWNDLKKEWAEYALTLGITQTVEFVWWGLSELTGLLTKTNYRNQLVYWFGIPDFNSSLIDRINGSNIELLGKRYSPNQHVETSSGICIEAFSWGNKGKEKIISAYLGVAEKWREIERRPPASENLHPDTKELTQLFRDSVEKVLAFRWPRQGYPQIRPITDLCKAAVEHSRNLRWKLSLLNRAEKERRSQEKGAHKSSVSGPYETQIRNLGNLVDALDALLETTDVCQSADDHKLLLLGEAGSGKSHLMADLVTSVRASNQTAIILLGEQFLGSEDPWSVVVKILGWNHAADELLAALDQEGTLSGRPSLLCIDALNESEHRRLWQTHLVQFADRIAQYPNIKLLVSCRSDFARLTLPESIWHGKERSWTNIQHRGFGAEVIEAIRHYFEAFNVRTSYFPPSLVEFRNPLFLRVFCEAFQDQDLPKGPLGFDRVMRARVDRLSIQIKREIDCDPEDTRAALRDIAKAIAAKGGRPISRETARELTLKHFPNRDSSSSLYGRLLSNGMLVESINEGEIYVRFPFERFSDYFIASQILNGITSVDDFRSMLEEGNSLAHLQDYWNYYENRGVARALAILTPERMGFEFAEMLPEPATRELVLEDFLESLAWRGSDSFSSKSDSLLEEIRKSGGDLLPTYVRVATIPQHPYNSKYLGDRLAGFALPERELAWTIPLSYYSTEESEGTLEEFLDWCFRAPNHLIPDEQALLAGRLLLWFCTSNHRGLRKRSTIAAIRILAGRSSVVIRLICELGSIDDPYLIERLYAVAAGVAMRLPQGDGLSALAQIVHSQIFDQGCVTPNILVRDFANTVLEVCFAKECLPANIDPASFRPPFTSTWPEILSDEDVKHFEDDDDWSRIISSVRSEGMGGYGDFGRYVMDAKVFYFSDRRLSQPQPDSDYRGHFSGLVARRWILQRIDELGWTGERFAEYERRAPYGRQRHDIEQLKLERISKKYQWIALRELLGHLSDHFWLAPGWRTSSATYSGAWQLNTREFDPSQRLVDLDSEDETSIRDSNRWPENYPNPFRDIELCEDRVRWVTHKPDDFRSLISLTAGAPIPSQQWLALAGHHEWVEPEYDRVTNQRDGTLKMWIDVRSFIVKKKDRTRFIKAAQSKHFYGKGCDVPEEHDGWIGAYPWSRSFDELRESCADSDAWIRSVSVPYETTVCVWREGATRIPSPKLCEILSLDWSGEGGTFNARTGDVVIGHPGGEAADWGRPLVVQQRALEAALDSHDLSIVWCVLAERTCWCSESDVHITGQELQVSAVYWLRGGKLTGGFTRTIIQEIPYR